MLFNILESDAVECTPGQKYNGEGGSINCLCSQDGKKWFWFCTNGEKDEGGAGGKGGAGGYKGTDGAVGKVVDVGGAKSYGEGGEGGAGGKGGAKNYGKEVDEGAGEKGGAEGYGGTDEAGGEVDYRDYIGGARSYTMEDSGSPMGDTGSSDGGGDYSLGNTAR